MSENVFDKAKILDEEWSKVLIGRLSSRPNAKTAYGSGGYDANAMKAAFDAQGNLLKERHNTLVNYARAEESARAEAETARDTAETARNNAENGYYDEDGEFVPGRVQNEEARISAEGKRQEYYKDVDTIVGIIKDTQNAIIEGGGDAIISFIHPYPVGSIYISINETDPGTLFGGTWERLKDRFLLSAGDTYSAGATGGSADAVLLKHTHNIIDNSTQQNSFNAKIGLGGAGVSAGGGWVLSTEQGTNGYYHRESELIEKSTNRIIATNPLPSSVDGTIADSGAGRNMPPYLTVYMWKRIA